MNSSDLKNSDILIRSLAGETSLAEEEQISQWLAASPSNKAHMEQLKLLWDDKATVPINKHTKDEEQLNKLFGKIDKREALETSTNKRSMYNWIIRAAAVLVLALISFWFAGRDNVAEKTIASDARTKKELKLADGSYIYLNSETMIRYPEAFNGDTREISMQQGEAYYEIAADKEKPFIIHTPKATIQVVGTAFNVSIQKQTGAVVVTVAEGIVKLFAAGQEQQAKTLTAGMCGVYSSSGQLKAYTNAEKNYLTWKTGIFIFEKDSLAKVFRDLSAYYRVTFTTGQDEIRAYKLSARYSNRSIDEIIEMLKDTYAITIEKQGDMVSINTINE